MSALSLYEADECGKMQLPGRINGPDTAVRGRRTHASLTSARSWNAFALPICWSPPRTSFSAGQRLCHSRLDTFSYNNGYDLTPHVLTWRTDNLDDVKLDQEAHELPHLEELLSGSTALTLSLGYDLGRAYIIARRARGVYTVFFQDAGGDVVSAAPIFLAAQAGLQGVASLEVSSSALSAFLPILSALPALKQLGVYIEARAPDDDAPHALPSDALFTLPRAVKA